jgi:hypothetical protein
VKIVGDDLVFSSGRVRDANGAIVGLSPDLEVYGGYDGSVYVDQEEEPDFNYREKEDWLTKADLQELADYMIAQWRAFKTKHS